MLNLRSLSALALLLLSVAGAAPAVQAADAAKINVDRYPEVDLVTLRATPEKFKNKRIRIITYYKGFLITFPEYMERSGFKADKYYWLRIVPNNLPAMVRKSDAMNELIPGLDRGKVVTLYGKINNFNLRHRTRRATPEYYLDLEHIEVMDESAVVDIPQGMLQEESEGEAGIPGAEPPNHRPRGPRWR